MTRKTTAIAGFAAGLALVAGIAWSGYGDDRARIEDLRSPFAPGAN